MFNTKNSLYLTLAAGFAMFSMFFGSGNLVFPLTLGTATEGNYLFATLGILITGVLFPFLGLYAILLFNGSYTRFFLTIDKRMAFWLPLILLIVLGPFGVIPRTITVAHGSFLLLFPDTPIMLFSLIMTITVFFLVLDRRNIIPLLGLILTPLLLISLTAIVIAALFAPIPNSPPSTITAMQSFSIGFFRGYLLMDLVSAFFFANFIVRYVERTIGEKIECQVKERRIVMAAIITAAALLAVIYSAFVYLGIKYVNFLDPAHPEQSLGLIAQQSLGDYASPFVVIAVVLACLTTAVAITSICAKFIQTKITRGTLGYVPSILIVLAITWFVSYFEFGGIATLISPIIEFIYPAIIVLTLFNILHKKFSIRFIRIPFYLTLLGAIGYTVY